MLTKLQPKRFLRNTTFIVYFEITSSDRFIRTLYFCYFQRYKITIEEISVQYHIYSIFCNPSSDRLSDCCFFVISNVTKLQSEIFPYNTTFIVYFVILHQTAYLTVVFLFYQHYKNITGNISAQYHKYSIFVILK